MFAPDVSRDPIDQYLRAAERAKTEGVDTAPAALATADAQGRPSLRVILVRGVDQRGFVFYTNYGSRKARELTGNPHAALCQHWPALEEQIRVEGRVELVDPQESDRYFAGRPRDSQLGAWASEQSRPLDHRGTFETRFEEARMRFDGGDVPRPPYWTGFRLLPERIEFWEDRPHRLHHRRLFTRRDDGWSIGLLYP